MIVYHNHYWTLTTWFSGTNNDENVYSGTGAGADTVVVTVVVVTGVITVVDTGVGTGAGGGTCESDTPKSVTKVLGERITYLSVFLI